MKILIIDDDDLYIKRLKNDVSKYFSNTVDRIFIDCFLKVPNKNALADFYDIAFIDIEIHGQSGIIVAKTLKESGACNKVVFVSFHDHLIFDTLSIQPYYFLRKSSYDKDLKILFNIFNNDFKAKKMIELHSLSGNYIIAKEDIIYVEAFGRYVLVFTLEDKYEDRNFLKDFISYLNDDCFVQTHRSFFVNMNHVVGYNHEFVFMDKENKVPLSRSFKNAFLLKYEEKLIW